MAEGRSDGTVLQENVMAGCRSWNMADQRKLWSVVGVIYLETHLGLGMVQVRFWSWGCENRGPFGNFCCSGNVTKLAEGPAVIHHSMNNSTVKVCFMGSILKRATQTETGSGRLSASDRRRKLSSC